MSDAAGGAARPVPRVAVAVASFNRGVTDELLAGALAVLEAAGLAPPAVRIVRVPGAFELPLAAQKLAASGEWDAVVCLGAVIRGETPHFDFVATAAARGIARVALDTGVPVAFGVLTTDTEEQAWARAGGPAGNKGAEAAAAALAMVRELG